MKMISTARSERQSGGFTLLEVMIAMTILAITMVAILRSQSQSISMSGGSRSMTTLCLLAQFKMTEMESKVPLTDSSDSGDFGTDFPGYTWQIQVAGSGQANLKRIEVNVTNNLMTKDNKMKFVMYKYSGQ
jgi:general secretion pathway protein I